MAKKKKNLSVWRQYEKVRCRLGMCVVMGERLGFVRKGGYFCIIKTYVHRFFLGGLMDSLLNKKSHLILKHNCPKNI